MLDIFFYSNDHFIFKTSGIINDNAINSPYNSLASKADLCSPPTDSKI